MLQTSFSISPDKLRSIADNSKKCVKAVHLIYVSDSEAGIRRIKKGKGFIYILDGEKISNPEELLRIKKIVIPPAWKKVWICKDPNGHIQATGYDMRGRKQYRYHPVWNELRNHTKFSKLLSFGEKLPELRAQLEKDLALKDLCEDKVLATIISLMESTYIRIGNTEYEKMYGSYGLTTFKDKHVKIKEDQIQFSFIGKKGKEHKITVQNKKLAKIVKACRDIPGKELFQYYDKNGLKHTIDSGRVNRYIQDITNEDFTAKDFRTWAGTLNALHAFQTLNNIFTEKERKQKINEVLDFVSRKLGNTKSVCKKYYIHPLIFDLYESHSLDLYLQNKNNLHEIRKPQGLTTIEIILLQILRTN
jgi:DNA topoisomerase I